MTVVTRIQAVSFANDDALRGFGINCVTNQPVAAGREILKVFVSTANAPWMAVHERDFLTGCHRTLQVAQDKK